RLQTDDAVFAGALQALGQQLDTHPAAQSQQPANELMALDAFGGQDQIQVGTDCRPQGAQVLFLRLGRAMAMPRMVWLGLVWRTELLIADTLGRQWIFCQALAPLINLQSIVVFQEFNLLALGARHPVIIGSKGGKAILVGAAAVVPVRRWQMGRQLDEVLAFVFKGLG